MTREPDIVERLRQSDVERREAADEIERVRALLRRHHLRGAYWDSELAVETRAALKDKP